MLHAEIKSHLTRYEIKLQLECVWLITRYACMSVLHTIIVVFIAIEWVWIDKKLFLYPHDDSIVRTMERHNLIAIKFVGIKAVFPQWHLLNYSQYWLWDSSRNIWSNKGHWNPSINIHFNSFWAVELMLRTRQKKHYVNN